jgi:hypothetical protein
MQGATWHSFTTSYHPCSTCNEACLHEDVPYALASKSRFFCLRLVLTLVLNCCACLFAAFKTQLLAAQSRAASQQQQQWQASAEKLREVLSPQTLADAAWALGRFSYKPPADFLLAFAAAVDEHAAAFDTKAWAVIIWGFVRMGAKPKRPWLLGFKGKAGVEYDAQGAQQLAKYMVTMLMQKQQQPQQGGEDGSGGRNRSSDTMERRRAAFGDWP